MGQEPTEPAPNNRALVRRWLEALSGPDFGALEDILADDVQLSTSPSVRTTPLCGRATVLRRLESVFTSGRYYEPGTFRWGVHSIVADGDITVCRATGSASFPNGNAYENEYLIWQRWRGQKLAEMLELFDPTHWSDQRNQ